MLNFLIAFVSSVLVSAGLTRAARTYTLSQSILDLPNARSSHSSPVPRGGGLAIASVVLLGVAGAGAMGLVDRDLVLALCGGGAAVAGVGWIDDRRHVPAHTRTVVHVLAASWAVWLLDGFNSVRLAGQELVLAPVGPIVAVLCVVWLINLYNFMDGIDGIAGGEAVVVGLAGAALTWYTGFSELAMCSLITAGAAAGFLLWNWSPAKIFMGDVGSGFLGFVFGTLSIGSEIRGSVPLLLWILLLGVFVFDATLTLVRRVVRGERWYSAHRSHAYQRAVEAGFSHARVTLGALIISLLLAAIVTVAVAMPALQLAAFIVGFAILGTAHLVVELVRPMHPVHRSGARDE